MDKRFEKGLDVYSTNDSWCEERGETMKRWKKQSGTISLIDFWSMTVAFADTMTLRDKNTRF